ncbi:MAG: Methionyl-tRNA synthetase [candidate division TM6 bacterium GW2011_GWF2_28_16]|nr:MAG: Methionyl-tRNA synthetase [candidate division TM6 bacterium GW2011_GWF2_28_16]
MNKNKFYVTTPIYYVNSKPHLGTLYSTLIADVAARWNKLLGKQVYFLTGTDEHGQKVEEAAQKNNKAPKDFVDSMIPAFKNTWQNFELDYNKFIRTTDKEHEQAVTSLLNILYNNNDIYKSTYSGWYCVPCETYVTINPEIKKDQDGKYLCPTCNRVLKELEEESYFFRLSSYQDKLLEFYEKNPDFIVPKEKLNEVISFVKSGLKDLSISRKNIKWGIPLPWDNTHTAYVWSDALTNYISAIGFGSKDQKDIENFNKYWPADLQVMAKDIIRFHAVYWPSFLMAANVALPKKLLVHGYILTDGAKMSKSLGNATDPNELANLFGVEPLRYYLLRQMSINQDGHFDIQDLQTRIASDLANNLGNLLNRTVTLAINNNLINVSAPEALEPKTVALKEKCEAAYRSFWDAMNHYQFHTALSELWIFISQVNAFFHEQQPWTLAKTDKEMFEEVIYAVTHSLYVIGVLLWPVMPKKSQELLSAIGHDFNLNNNYEQDLRNNIWNKKFVLNKLNEPLFIRPEIDMENSDSAKKDSSLETKITDIQDFINIEDFTKVKLIVGTIIECEPVAGSDKLLKLLVDMGSLGKKQVLSGVAPYFKPEELIGKQGVYVQNLKPRKMMGLDSNGMMLFAKDESGNMRMVTVAGSVDNGTRLS